MVPDASQPQRWPSCLLGPGRRGIGDERASPGKRSVLSYRTERNLHYQRTKSDFDGFAAAIECGHFLPEENPDETLSALNAFFNIMIPESSPSRPYPS
jgi:hypothetical protein